MKMGEVMDRAVRGKDPQAAIMVAEFLRAFGLNYDDQFAFLKKKYPKLTLSNWDALLYDGEYDSALRKWDIFSRKKGEESC